MACYKRERTGDCSHYQCPFSSETKHGYECVDVLHYEGIDFCEEGQDCIEKCPYSFAKESERGKTINNIPSSFYGI